MIQGIIKNLNFQNFTISITTRTSKQNEFDTNKVQYLQFDIKNDAFFSELIDKTDIFVFTLPPIEWESFARFFNGIPEDKRIIFTSSISVYEKNQGKIDENGLRLSPENNLLVKCENFLIKKFKNLIILRLGGLYGKNRHPIYHLSGKTDLKGAEDLIHLVDHEDVQAAILKILDQNILTGIYNIISDQRVTKKIYYTNLAHQLNLPLPQYKEMENIEAHSPNNISNNKSKNDLKLIYKNPNDFLGVENE